MPTAHPAAGLTVGVRENPTSYQPGPGDIDDSAGPWKPNARNAWCRDTISTVADAPTVPFRSGASAIQRSVAFEPPRDDGNENALPASTQAVRFASFAREIVNCS